MSPDRYRREGTWSQEVADGSDRSVREERPSGGVDPIAIDARTPSLKNLRVSAF